MEKFRVSGPTKLAGEVSISGAKNAALLAASILSINDPIIAKKLDAFRTNQTNMVLKNSDPRK